MPNQPKEFTDLFAKSNRALFAFLQTELKLGFTFATAAERYHEAGNQDRYQINKRNAIAAIEAIERFKWRLSDDRLSEIEAGQAQLVVVVGTL